MIKGERWGVMREWSRGYARCQNCALKSTPHLKKVSYRMLFNNYTHNCFKGEMINEL